VDTVVDLAPGADHDPLAQGLAARVRAALEDAGSARLFRRMRGAVGIVADDADTALTLRFDFGRLTIHEGLVGVPTVTIRGHTRSLEALSNLPGISTGGILASARSVPEVLRALRVDELKVYGLMSHPRLVLRLLRLLAADPGSNQTPLG
jgi:hypothetical protein